MRSSEQIFTGVTQHLLKGSPDRPASKALLPFDSKCKDYNLKPSFMTYLHPDNLEDSLVKYLRNREEMEDNQFGQHLLKQSKNNYAIELAEFELINHEPCFRT